MSRKKWTALDKPPLSEPVLEVIKDMGFSLMTPVQVRFGMKCLNLLS